MQPACSTAVHVSLTCSCPASSIHGTRNRICRRRQERRQNQSRRMHVQDCTCKVAPACSALSAHAPCCSHEASPACSPAARARTAGQTRAAAPAAAQTRAAGRLRGQMQHVMTLIRWSHVPGCAVLLHLGSCCTSVGAAAAPRQRHHTARHAHKLPPTCIEAATSLTAARNSGWSGSRSLAPSSTRLSPGCSMPSSQSSCIRLGERGEGSCRWGSGAGRVG